MDDEQISSEITQLLKQLGDGDVKAADRLYARVYQQLRRMAKSQMRGERGDASLQATELIHEAFLRLVEAHERNWANRTHFYSVAARVMRRILVDRARARRALKRGAGEKAKDFQDVAGGLGSAREDPDMVIGIDQALDRLAALYPRPAQIVEMRYFAGYTETEIAGMLAISDRTVKRDWDFARAWLRGELGGERAAGAGV